MTESQEESKDRASWRRVSIEDHTGKKVHEARLAPNASMSELVPALVSALGLPVADSFDRAITYHLAFDNRQLQRDETLNSSQVIDGANLALIPEMTSGRGVADKISVSTSQEDLVLRIHAKGEVLVETTRKFLSTVEDAYNSGYVFESIVEQAREIASKNIQHPLPISTLLWNFWWPPSEEKIAAFIPNSDKLVLRGVTLKSPGFWDFVGSANPLNFILEFINQRHEHRKDREYRNFAEEEKLRLENELAQIKIIQEKLSVLKDLGASKTELAVLRDQLLGRSFNSLREFQDNKQVVNAEIVNKSYGPAPLMSETDDLLMLTESPAPPLDLNVRPDDDELKT